MKYDAKAPKTRVLKGLPTTSDLSTVPHCTLIACRQDETARRLGKGNFIRPHILKNTFITNSASVDFERDVATGLASEDKRIADQMRKKLNDRSGFERLKENYS